MGLQLILLPVDYENDSSAESYTIFHCDKEYYLFDQIREIEVACFPKKFIGFFEYEEQFRHGLIKETPYGEELTYALVKDLLRCFPHPEAPRNQAIWAYLSKLSPSTKVGLYWH